MLKNCRDFQFLCTGEYDNLMGKRKEYVSEVDIKREIESQRERSKSLRDPPPPIDLQIPECKQDIDSTRLFLAHSGILSPKMFDRSVAPLLHTLYL